MYGENTPFLLTPFASVIVPRATEPASRLLSHLRREIDLQATMTWKLYAHFLLILLCTAATATPFLIETSNLTASNSSSLSDTPLGAWEYSISETLHWFQHTQPLQAKSALFWSLEVFAQPLDPNTPLTDRNIGLTLLNVARNEMYAVVRKGDGEYQYASWTPNQAEKQHGLFDWADLRSLSISTALELADLEAEAQGMEDRFVQCTISRFDFEEPAQDLLYLFGGILMDQDVSPVVIVNARTREVSFKPTLQTQYEEVAAILDRNMEERFPRVTPAVEEVH